MQICFNQRIEKEKEEINVAAFKRIKDNNIMSTVGSFMYCNIFFAFWLFNKQNVRFVNALIIRQKVVSQTHITTATILFALFACPIRSTSFWKSPNQHISLIFFSHQVKTHLVQRFRVYRCAKKRCTSEIVR